MFTTRRSNIVRDLVYGGVGGVAGTLLIGPVTTALQKLEPEEKKERERQLNKETPTAVLAERLITFAGAKPTDHRKHTLSRLIHLSYGISWGAIYGVLRNRAPWVRVAFALPFGIGFALIGDELMNSLMGLTPPPKAYPLEAHLRSLVGHIAFAAATESTFRGLAAAIG